MKASVLKSRRALGLTFFTSLVLIVALLAETASADKVGLVKSKDGIRVRYTVVTLFPCVKIEAYPAIISFPGGWQDSESGEGGNHRLLGPGSAQTRIFCFRARSAQGISILPARCVSRPGTY